MFRSSYSCLLPPRTNQGLQLGTKPHGGRLAV